MKFTKFIPLVCALALTVPAFAASTDTESTEFTLTNPAYFNIEVTSSNLSGTGTIAEDGEGVISLSYTTPMAVTYRVVNNQKNHNIYVHGTALKDGGGTAKALGGEDEDNLKLVFAHNTVKPTSGAIGDAAAASSTAANNKNAIAFPFNLGDITETEGSIADPTYASNKLTYVAQAGTFVIPYTLGTAPSPNTFSSIDESGTYKATLIITDVSPF